MNPGTVTEADLHAYVDGVLPPARAAEVETYLAAHADEAARIAAYRRQKDALRAQFNPVLDEPISPRLTRRSDYRPWKLQHMAAGLLIAALSGSTGWLLHGQVNRTDAYNVDEPYAMARRAAIAHVVYSPEVRRPVEVAADQEEQLVTWLSKRLGTKVSPPKLGTAGYELVGGRLLPGDSAPVAQFMYQNATGQRLTLYVSNEHTSNRDTGFRFAQEDGVNVFYWIDGPFGYALSGGITKDELNHIANLVYGQLEIR